MVKILLFSDGCISLSLSLRVQQTCQLVDESQCSTVVLSLLQVIVTT